MILTLKKRGPEMVCHLLPQLMQAPKAANPGLDFGNQGLNKKPSSSNGIDSDHGKDADPPSTNSPGATGGDPPQEANSRPDSEKNGDGS